MSIALVRDFKNIQNDPQVYALCMSFMLWGKEFLWHETPHWYLIQLKSNS